MTRYSTCRTPAQHTALTALAAEYPTATWSYHADLDTNGHEEVFVSATLPHDGLTLDWYLYSDGELFHISTRYPYGSAGWEPNPHTDF